MLSFKSIDIFIYKLEGFLGLQPGNFSTFIRLTGEIRRLFNRILIDLEEFLVKIVKKCLEKWTKIPLNISLGYLNSSKTLIPIR